MKKNEIESYDIGKMTYRVGVTGILLNILLFVIKFIVGAISSSVSVMVDAFNNLSDVASAVITIIGAKIAQAPPDPEHPFGHERVHYITGMIISCIVAMLGVGFLQTSIGKIINPEELNIVPVMFVFLIISVIVKMYIFKINMDAYEKTKVPSLKATALDAKGDALITVSIIASIGFYQATGLMVDGLVGCLVAVNIIKAGVESLKESINSILGEPACENKTSEIMSIIEGYDEIKNVHDLMIHNYGITKSIASVHTEVSSSLDIFEVHEILDEIEKKVLSQYGIELVIHADPLCEDEQEIEEALVELERATKKLNNRLSRKKNIICSYENFRIIGRGSKKNFVFDMIVCYEANSHLEKEKNRNKTNEKIEEYISKELKMNNPGYNCLPHYIYKKTEVN